MSICELCEFCVRSGDYEDVRLFVPRKEVDELVALLNSFLRSRSNRRRVLVTGERGVGKSIGVRSALNILSENNKNIIPLVISGDKCKRFRDILLDISEELKNSVASKLNDQEVIYQASFLSDYVKIDFINRGKLYTQGIDIEQQIGIDYGILGFIKANLGIKGKISDNRQIQDISSIPVGDHEKIDLIVRFIKSLAINKKIQIILFIDNLDQVTEVNNKEIDEVLKNILRFGDIITVMTVRIEFVAEEILRENNIPIIFEELNSEQLLAILTRRLKDSKKNYSSVINSALIPVSKKLASITGNPYAYLRWIEYLCTFSDLNEQNYIDILKVNYLRAFHSMGYTSEIEKIFSWYINNKLDYAKIGQLRKELKLNKDDIVTYERQGIIIPNDRKRKLHFRDYRLAPQLDFLKLGGKRA